MQLEQTIIGMIHVPALPGTPRYAGQMSKILQKVAEEAKIYQAAGIDAIAIENMHDVPYLNRAVGPEIIASMTQVAQVVKDNTDLPCGIQILAGANQAALAVALVVGLDFIRAEGFVFSHIADEGSMQSDAGELLRYRKQIGAEHIAVYTDIKKKHSAHAITDDVSLVETAKAAQFFLSDGVIVTGASTGETADIAQIAAVKKNLKIPVLVGSGVTFDNVEHYLLHCDGLIIGSWFKKGGHWTQDLDRQRVKQLMDKVNALR
ncbi:MAG: BtpA/SgcQ family protein [Bacteroidota bacterium]